MQNHQLSFQVGAVENDDIRLMCDKMNIMLTMKKIKCDNFGLTSVLEISPDRKKVCKAYFSAVDAMKTVGNDASWEACGRSLNIYTVPNSEVLWEYNRNDSTGKWNEAMVAQSGYDLSALASAMED